MWNLIRKDLFIQKKMLLLMLSLLLVAIYFVTSTTWVGIVFSIAIIMQTFYADEKTSIHLLLNSLPYTRKEIVSSKYVGACILMIFILMTIFIGHFIIYKEIFPWNQMFIMISTVFVFISFAFPFSYLFHSQYLLIAFGVLFVVYLMVMNLFMPNLNDIVREITRTALSMGNYQLYLIMILGVLALFIASWILSNRIYRKKVF